TVAASLVSGERFARSLTGCAGFAKSVGPSCAWAEAGGRRTRFGATSENLRFAERGAFLGMGFHHDLGTSGLSAGFGFSWESGRARTSGADSEGERYQLGLNLRRDFGPFDAMLCGTYGKGNFDLARAVQTPLGLRTAMGKQSFVFGQAGLLLGAHFPLGQAWVRAEVGVAYHFSDREALLERGAAPLDLAVLAAADHALRVSPRLVVGEEFTVGRATVRPQLAAGVTHLFDAPVESRMRFSSARDVGAFTQYRLPDRTRANVSAALELETSEGARLDLYYRVDLGGDDLSQAFGARMRVPF